MSSQTEPAAVIEPRVFCTLFDTSYLTRAVALYRSLEATGIDFRLRAYAMDEAAAVLLDRLSLPKVSMTRIDQLELEDPELAVTRSTRSWAEYCFTATPCVCRHSLLSEPALAEVTYLDADLMFFSDPTPLFSEVGAAPAAIVPHRFSSRWAHCAATHGRFNVGFNVFRNDAIGRAVVQWWREQCLNWCGLQPKSGRYGDQKYLDEFPTRFPEVHIVRDAGADVAPWNSEGSEITLGPEGIRVNGQQLIFYHFASLQLLTGRAAEWASELGKLAGGGVPALRNYRTTSDDPSVVWRPFPGYRLSIPEVQCLWQPYVALLLQTSTELSALESQFRTAPAKGQVRKLLTDVARGSVPTEIRRRHARARV